jgi:hypothetical protein
MGSAASTHRSGALLKDSALETLGISIYMSVGPSVMYVKHVAGGRPKGKALPGLPSEIEQRVKTRRFDDVLYA